jgi:hypothetical protein
MFSFFAIPFGIIMLIACPGLPSVIAVQANSKLSSILRKLWTYHFLFSPYFHRRFA